MTEKNANEVQVESSRKGKYPTPTVDAPDMFELLEGSLLDSGCEATDGCWVEPDGICSHGHPSWLLRMGLI